MSTTAQSSASTDSVNGDKIKVQEIQIPVPWGHISGKLWGSMDQVPILAIHGWMDNASSFDTLVPLLSGFAVLAIDIMGHGTSSLIPYGLYYHLDYEIILVLRKIIQYFRWKKVKLIGHSMGGAIAFLYAATFPDEVEFLICLDIASPSVWDLKKVATTMGQDIDKALKLETTPTKSPSYKYNDMIEIVFDAYDGSIDRTGAEILMKRGMQPASTPDTYSFSRDVRLKMKTMALFPLEYSLILASQITCEYLNIRYVPGLKYENAMSYQAVLDVIKKNAKRFEYHEVEGTHHAHLMHPERVAPIIINFLRNK